MKNEGFSLIEVLLVISVMIILMVIAVPQFSAMMRKYTIERETKELQANLTYARMRAMNTNRTHIVDLGNATTSAYSIADDSNGNLAIDAGETIQSVSLHYQITWSGAGTRIFFDNRGITNNGGTINVVTASNAAVDCVVITATRVNIGKFSGGSCVQR